MPIQNEELKSRNASTLSKSYQTSYNPGLLQKLPFCGKQTKKITFAFPSDMEDNDSIIVAN